MKPRFLTYMVKYNKAVARKDLEVLSRFVSWYASLPDYPNSTEAFEGIARQCMEMIVYAQNEILQVRMRQLSLLKEQHGLFMSSIHNQGLEGLSLAVGQSSTYEYDYSQVGWGYATRYGAEAATQFQPALAMNPVRPGDTVEMTRLDAMWTKVE
ncbi:hypothetical protein TSTA_124710 [Talaromyces stipitatus ATCC 10500]|uniref:Uncharacterized protein n=1 Tax=Talaromyces stipitatus (strain ATCC 10500 / CBS 375.48 / QM 6759 / NRRL 1006) TaxID=441959 RepID=B8MB51_TALSN|nr:uncharacterized protein TSTA_124710 [Talaromyces stipitatus ATCC 10500]EED18752.1 hypothetical protein TSTA_124710 [Talaromyces stipitatus ATCC 10500]